MMANAAKDFRNTKEKLEKVFLEAVNEQLPKLAGGWELAFGPVVYKTNPKDIIGPPLNAWFVATSKSRQETVLAIAGTAPRSYSGWTQDFEVQKVIDWKAWVSKWSSTNGVPDPVPTDPKQIDQTTPYVAIGTSHGARNVLNTSSNANPDKRVYQYLQTVPKGYTIYVTGHSMGGALSPAVGLGLVEAGWVNGNKVVVLPSAGASPGNNAFSKYWTSKFPPSGSKISAINSDFHNVLDIVPYAWSIDPLEDLNITKLKTLWAPEPPLALEVVIKGVTAKAKNSGVEYLAIPSTSFPSKVAIGDVVNLPFKVFHEQHVIAYEEETGVRAFIKKFKDIFRHADGISEIQGSDDGEAELKRIVEENSAGGDEL